MEERIRNWDEVVPEINEAEALEVSVHLSIPAVQKYFRKVALEEMLSHAKTPMVDILGNQQAHLVDIAYSKGRLSLASEVIDYAIQHQKARQLPLK